MNVPSRRRWTGVLVAVAALVVAGCQPAVDDPTPTVAASSLAATATAPASAEPSAAESPSSSVGAPGEEVSVFDVEEGDCFDADGDELESVTVVDCDEPHTYEAFHVFDHEAGDDAEYPGDEAMTEYAETECRAPFEDYVERDYETSIWYISWITPSDGTWADGDREILCTLHQQDENEDEIRVTGSAEGSGD